MEYNSLFSKEVHDGLSSSPKILSSKYFYDEAGDHLFRKIMALPEYYLTRSEAEIFDTQSENIIEKFGVCGNQDFFELIELGAGDGAKTIKLLSSLSKANCNFSYIPLDISGHVLNILKENILNELPSIVIQPVEGDYFESLQKLKGNSHPKIILFLGSSIGNMTDEIASAFITSICVGMNDGDKLLLGVDLIKSQEVVLPAYNDSSGITKEFNINLLRRINTELGGNFDTASFSHKPSYTEEEGIARSFLQSEKEQTVFISSTNSTYKFAEGEKIQTEISRKYDDGIINKIISGTCLKITNKFMDKKEYFADYLLQKKSHL